MTTDTERDRAEEAARRMRLRVQWRDHLEQAAFWRHYGAKRAAHHEARAAKYARR